MLWIAISLPRIALEVFLRGTADSPSSAREAHDESQTRADPLPIRAPWVAADAHTVLVANDTALAHGVRPGMTLSAAYALSPHMQVRRRDPALEAEVLQGLAAWAGQFTPAVSIEGHGGLLLEVSGSLRLFEGIEPIATRLRLGLARLGFGSAIACAPTARAAWWLARSGKETIVERTAELGAKIAALSIHTLDWSPDTLASLVAIGTNTLGEVMALPRAGFARRFGQHLLKQIDQALGRVPEPRAFVVPPERFQARLALPAPVEAADALLFAVRRLIVQLAGYLAARACGVQRFDLQLQHRERPETRVSLGFVSPRRDEAHFTLLVRERLAHLALPAPVEAIVLLAEEIVPLTGASLALFHDRFAASPDWARLVERLRARLGTQAVHGLTMAAEHRPEYVVRVAEPGTRPPALRFGERPLWLLDAPQPLPEVDAKPFRRGPLALVAGPERIESGWWDGHDIVRDYFIAQDADQALLWVYRERREAGGWFLHGVFG